MKHRRTLVMDLGSSRFKMRILIKLIGELGWDIAFPQAEDDNVPLKGMIIGEPEYVNYILSELPD